MTRKRRYRVHARVVPTELVGKTAVCEKCGKTSAIDWVGPLPFPKEPVPASGGGYWVPTSVPLFCACGHQTNLAVPPSKGAGRARQYGDEASRNIKLDGGEELHFRCLSMVSLAQADLHEWEVRLNALKRDISPERDPATWRLHYLDIANARSGSSFNFVDGRAKADFALRVADLLRNGRCGIHIVCGAIKVRSDAGKKRKASIKHLNQEIFALSLLDTLRNARSQGIVPMWTFDNIKDATVGSPIEGWANEVFLGLQHMPLFTWLSESARIDPPTFVKPGSHVGLELADFISYWAAREFQCAFKGEVCEMSTAAWGASTYAGVNDDGDLLYETATGMPLKRFFGIDRVER